jgi:hypothetical protein
MVMGVLILFGSVFPYIAVAGPSYSTSEKMGASIMPATAFALCLDRIAGLESSEQGATNGNLATVVNNFSLSQGFGMLILMIFLFLFLTWYLDNVLPSEFGVPKPPWFPLTTSTRTYKSMFPLAAVCSWCCKRRHCCVEYWKEVCPCRRKGNNAVHVRTYSPSPVSCPSRFTIADLWRVSLVRGRQSRLAFSRSFATQL